MTAPGPFSAVAAEFLLAAERDVAAADDRYQKGESASAYWLMADLRSSAGFRQLAGDRQAYVRAEVFAGTFRRAVAPYPDASVFKELGDAVLVRSPGLRAAVEVACLHWAVDRTWAASRRSPLRPRLGARIAVSFGAAVRLDRDGSEDYVGTALDRLARISGEDQDDAVVFLIDDQGYRHGGDLLAEYPFLTATGPHLAGRSKPGEAAVRFWRVTGDVDGLAEFRDLFARLR